MKQTLVVLLSHQQPNSLAKTIELWQAQAASGALLLAYGGDAKNFPAIPFAQKIFIEDPSLRMQDQQRGRQSLQGVVAGVRDFLETHPKFDSIYLVEYDQIPLVSNVLERLAERMEEENADVLAHHLHRVDGTSSAHYLYHNTDERFHRFFASVSQRTNNEVIFSMLGTGSFWGRDAFLAVAQLEEPFPIYLELFLPTLAHHLGFRLRDLADQNPFVMHLGDRGAEIETAQAQGAWTLHPVKHLPAPFRA